MIGLRWRDKSFGPSLIVSPEDKIIEITKDEGRNPGHGPAKNMTLLTCAYLKDTKEDEPMDWVIPYGKGRVYVTMLGHLWKNGPDTAMRCVGFQTMLIRGCEWAATGKVTHSIPKAFPRASEIKLAQTKLRQRILEPLPISDP
jgi:hypothetical protein